MKGQAFARTGFAGLTCLVSLLFAASSLLLIDLSEQPQTATRKFAEPRFERIDLFVNPKSRKLAAYQIEILDKNKQVEIVGVEGGAHPAFDEPPYYDPAALKNNRIILAAYSLTDELPHATTRVATVHVLVPANSKPAYELSLTAAGANDGATITGDSTAHLVVRREQ